ncbi:MAG: hypothetical protein ACYC0T_11770 [Ramlibacter sp.]
MAHDVFGLPSESHEILSLAVVNGALLLLVPVALVSYLCWRDRRRAGKSIGMPRRPRRARRQRRAGS